LTKKILIIGASGLVGSVIANHASKNYDLYLVNNTNNFSLQNFPVSNIDLTKNLPDLIDIINEYKPDFVVNTVAYPNVDFCETNPQMANFLHVETTRNISKACSYIGSKIIYFSTDAVFDGKSSRKYTETDLPNPINHYGTTKLNAEKILLENNLNTVLRTTVIYGWHNKSRFTNWVLNSLNKSQQVTAFTDQCNTPTLVDDIAKIILNIFSKEKTGLYHMVGPSCLSRYEFALKLAKKFNLEENLIIPTSFNDKKQMALRPSNGCLDNSKLENEIDFKFTDIDRGIEFIYEQSKREVL
jgi:dTDP-4-dehydrorhamnose reductase